MWGFEELEYIPQRSPSGGLSRGRIKPTTTFFSTQYSKNTLKFLPILKSYEISHKTCISRASLKMGNSMRAWQLYAHKVKSRLSWAEAAGATRWCLCPSRWAVPTTLCCQHLHVWGRQVGLGVGGSFSNSLIWNLTLRFMIYTLPKSLKQLFLPCSILKF